MRKLWKSPTEKFFFLSFFSLAALKNDEIINRRCEVSERVREKGFRGTATTNDNL
jgi:hypothetical protein